MGDTPDEERERRYDAEYAVAAALPTAAEVAAVHNFPPGVTVKRRSYRQPPQDPT